jgi:hypothetical protein
MATLLTGDAAAEHAGVCVETIWAWDAWGFISPVQTVIGPRYALHEIQAVLDNGRQLVARTRYLKAGDAASRLGVGWRTLARKAGEGRLAAHRDRNGRRMYDAAEITAIAAKRAEPGLAAWWPEPRPTD